MNDITLAQTAPISSLPRDYKALFAKSKAMNEPVVLLRHSKTVGALISEKLLKQFNRIKKMYEEEKVLRIMAQAELEYERGEMLSSDDMSFAEMIGLNENKKV